MPDVVLELDLCLHHQVGVLAVFFEGNLARIQPGAEQIVSDVQPENDGHADRRPGVERLPDLLHLAVVRIEIHIQHRSPIIQICRSQGKEAHSEAEKVYSVAEKSGGE